jgi:energy-converting hydrogenase B subunit D
LIPLQVAAMVLVGVAGLAVVTTRNLLRQALLNSFFGLQLVVLFLVFQAPDVALSALAVGGGAAPLVILATLAKLRARQERRR